MTMENIAIMRIVQDIIVRIIEMLFVFKVTHRCNLNCVYCEQHEKKIENFNITYSSLKNFFLRLNTFIKKKNTKKIYILFHGGEPSLLPLKLWEYIVDEIHRLRKKISLKVGVQTNLVIKDKRIINLWLQNSFKISSSLDGDFIINKKQRTFSNKIYKLVLENLDYIKQKQPNVGIVCVITKYSINFADKLYSFFENREINVRFNKVITLDSKLEINYIQFFNFLKKIAKMWLNNTYSKISIQPIHKDILALLGAKGKSCNRSINCWEWVFDINWLGDMYPCGRLDKVNEFYYGNISNASIENISELGKKYLQKFYIRNNKCRKCNFLFVCGMGCPAEFFYQSNGYIPEEYCLAFQDYILCLKNIVRNKVNLKTSIF